MKTKYVKLTLLLLFFLFTRDVTWAKSSISNKAFQIVQKHDLVVVEAIARYYLKQEVLIALESLERASQTSVIDVDKKSEVSLVEKKNLVNHILALYQQQFEHREWLDDAWVKILTDNFSDYDIGILYDHFSSAVGEKQMNIIDYQIAFQVQNTFTLAGKFKQLEESKDELSEYQREFNILKEKAKFSIKNTLNADGQAFALSPLGKKYFVLSMINVVGIINAKLYDMATHAPKITKTLAITKPNTIRFEKK